MYLTVLQNVGLNASLLTSLQIQNKRTEAPCHSASRDGVMLPSCDVCEDGLSLIRWFCCIVPESSKDTCDSCRGTSNRSLTTGASIQTTSVKSAVEMVANGKITRPVGRGIPQERRDGGRDWGTLGWKAALLVQHRGKKSPNYEVKNP